MRHSDRIQARNAFSRHNGEAPPMRDRDEYPYEHRDEDARRDAMHEARRHRWLGCLCGYPDMPGTCPGAAFCPMHGETPEEDEDDA